MSGRQFVVVYFRTEAETLGSASEVDRLKQLSLATHTATFNPTHAKQHRLANRIDRHRRVRVERRCVGTQRDVASVLRRIIAGTLYTFQPTTHQQRHNWYIHSTCSLAHC